MNFREIDLQFIRLPVIIDMTELLKELVRSMENCQADIESVKK